MGGIMQKFNVLLWKNFQVRKKHWGMSIFVQVIIPILLYALVNSLALVNTKGINKNISENIPQNGPAPNGSKSDLIENYPDFTNYWIDWAIGYTPQSDDTDKLMELVKKCVGRNTTGYQNETEMIDALMSLNGIKDWMSLLSWLVTGVIWNFLLLIPIVLMLKFSWVPESNAFMEKGNPVLIFMAFSLHIVHLLCFGYHVASYFNKPWKGVVTSILFLYIMSFAKPVMVMMGYEKAVQFVGILCPNLFVYGIIYAIERYERQGMTIGFGNMFSTRTNTDSFVASIGMIMLFSILGAILHFFMALYIHAIKPGKYGVKRHPFAWFLKKKNEPGDDQIQLDSDDFEQKKEFEKIPAGSLKAGVQIRKLKKIYSTGFINKSEFHALKEVSIDFYRGEITALLGHNGAGKTTMMSILSGLTGSSGGVVIINGQNVLNNHDVISNNVGLCPQVNITVPDLNVYQQVLFFAKLRAKNKTSPQIKEDVETLLSKVNLQDKKNCIPDNLSGGQKRRLCLALAVIGDANVLIFDEPTSGMDTEGKRDIWDMILAMKGNKTILISTHDMEEADILGDRIAIMHSGKLNSYGTSMFLKKLHGDGQVEVTLSLESGCDTAKILEIIGEDVKTLNQRNDSIVLAIPNSESLPETLDKLELSKKKLGITGISASIITLEQVFVKVTEEVDHNIDGTTNEIGNDSILFNENTGFNYFMQTLWGYLVKKYAYVMKSPWTFFISLIFPGLIVALILLCSLMIPSEQPIKTVDWTMNNESVFLYNEWKASEGMYITNRKDTNFVYGDEKFIIAEYNLFNKTLNICSNNSNLKIQVSKKDIHISTSSSKKENHLESILPYIMNISMFMIIIYISQPFRERKTGIKQLQDMTGASKIAYWGSMFLVDFVHYTISIILSLSYVELYLLSNIKPITLSKAFIMSKYHLIFFVISFVFFIGIIIIVEQKIIAKVLGKIKKNCSITNTTDETDELVKKERDIVSKEIEKRLTKTVEHNNENVFLAQELRKNYGNLQVVKDISFRVKSGECFGLLGVNGAGKSTTFKMLTGEESACHGKMYLKDIGMHENRGEYLSKMGYCPQHDALIETLNAWDHLYLFARLRGIPESQIKSSVEGWIKRLNLSACASRPSQTYSGGNKRRLNIALALIGQPSLVLMDEPTTGVDPAARRSLWNTLKYCQESGQSIIFTSHSMEECEALCNRLVIMVNGKLVCVGAVQELKQRFGAGYNIHVKMSPASSVEDVQHIKETIESTIRCQKMDENSGFLGYHVTDPGATWTVMYRMMNTLKNSYSCIEDFAVLSSTLEQLFIQFARADCTDSTSHEIP
ncbi:phospholipid-transporting ATPase ABCA3-like [Aphidius gifuensis]|uniref:phospholipid-transporting ATPase ABCA3-like n=1 Tax=Aphidius gifuensis TaxID=684658 RepID=UPI001CDBCE87|nr:phospholipid-transporting ATPase ABCA3-like [Aphidius gifuensis]